MKPCTKELVPFAIKIMEYGAAYPNVTPGADTLPDSFPCALTGLMKEPQCANQSGVTDP